MAAESLIFFGTQARILMTEWQALAKLIMAHSVPSMGKAITNIEDLESFDIDNLENITFSTAEELPHILAEKNIKLAFQGPFGAFLKDKTTAYAKIARIRLEIHLNNEELFKNKRALRTEEEKIPAKTLEKFNFKQLDEIQNSLDELTQAHNSQWQEFLEYWTEQLLNFFEKSKIKLTEREIKELADEVTAGELLPRFIEIGLKLPEKNYPSMNFSEYLYLKGMLTVQSALSRQHLPHDEAEIHQKLQGFKSSFADMKKQEQEFLAEQKKQTAATISPLE